MQDILMEGDWRLALFEHNGEWIELHDRQAAIHAVDNRRLTKDTAVVVYDDQGRSEHNFACKFKQFELLFAALDANDNLALRAVRARLLEILCLSLSESGRGSLAGRAVAESSDPPHTSYIESVADPAAPLSSPPIGVYPVPKKKVNWILWVGLVFAGVIALALLYPRHPGVSDTSSDPTFVYDGFSTSQIYRLATGQDRADIYRVLGDPQSITGQVVSGSDVIVVGKATDSLGQSWLVVRLSDGRLGAVKGALLTMKRPDRPRSYVPPPSDEATAVGAPTVMPAPVVFPTGFNCAKAKLSVEKVICGDAGLAMADRTMTALYRSLTGQLKGRDRQVLKSTQDRWRDERNNCARRADVGACIAHQYDVRIEALKTWPKHEPSSAAEASFIPPPPAAPVEAVHVRVGPVYVEGDWSFPTQRQASDYYPERAAMDEVEGTVTIDCIGKSDGKMESCKVLSETPHSYRFGEATKQMFLKYGRVKPSVPGGTLQPGEHRKFTYKWVLAR